MLDSSNDLLETVKQAAYEAGALLREGYSLKGRIAFEQKGASDFVSYYDTAAENIIIDCINSAFPDIAFLGEESGLTPTDSDYTVIIDPLDGTSNFLHGIPHFAISIAVQERKLGSDEWGEVTAGLVYQPITDESFWAEKSRGAWLQDARLRVSGRRHLADALFATGTPYQGHGNFGEWNRIFGAVGPQVAGIRRFGSAALDLAWVAAGRYDGFWESDLSAWDTAAGCLLVREAGGFVTDYRGRSLPICDGQVIAGSDPLHSRLHKIIAETLKGTVR